MQVFSLPHYIFKANDEYSLAFLLGCHGEDYNLSLLMVERAQPVSADGVVVGPRDYVYI